jgi:hypothetical protein
MYTFGAETRKPNLAEQLAKLAGSLSDIGVGAFAETEKARINKQRINAGLEMCTGEYGQPADCPPIFQPKGAAMPASATQDLPRRRPAKKSYTLYIVIGVILVIGVVAFMMSQKPGEMPPPM